MAELITVARPYAKAAFQFADEHNRLAEWSQQLAVAAAVSEDTTVAKLLQNPKITSAAKAEQFLALLGDELSPEVRNFVTLLAQNKRLPAMAEIAELYEQLKSAKERSVDVDITSTFELADGQTQQLAAALKSKLGQEVNVTSEVDASLLGGVIIRAGDLVIDGSVRGKLAKLAETMKS